MPKREQQKKALKLSIQKEKEKKQATERGNQKAYLYSERRVENRMGFE